jgi:hypothetical protein
VVFHIADSEELAMPSDESLALSPLGTEEMLSLPYWGGRVLADAVEVAVPAVEYESGWRRHCPPTRRMVDERDLLWRTISSRTKWVIRQRRTAGARRAGWPVVAATWGGLSIRAAAVEVGCGQSIDQARNDLEYVLGVDHFAADTIEAARVAARQRKAARYDRQLFGVVLVRHLPADDGTVGGGHGVLAGSVTWSDRLIDNPDAQAVS